LRHVIFILGRRKLVEGSVQLLRSMTSEVLAECSGCLSAA